MIKALDWSQWVTLHVAKTQAPTEENIDRVARDLDFSIALSGNMYYRGSLVETIFGADAREIALLVLTRRKAMEG